MSVHTTVLDEIASKGHVINRNHIAGAPVCSILTPLFFLNSFHNFCFFFFSQTNKQKLVLIAVLTGTVLPTSKTLEEVLREGLLHPGDPILLDTDDILSD